VTVFTLVKADDAALGRIQFKAEPPPGMTARECATLSNRTSFGMGLVVGTFAGGVVMSHLQTGMG